VHLVNAYLPHVHAAATVGGRVDAAFMRVSNLLDPPLRLLSPPWCCGCCAPTYAGTATAPPTPRLTRGCSRSPV
jgi:hypothetical protein